MTQRTFDALTRRASLLTVGTGVAALAGPLSAPARKGGKKGGNKANKKCGKQVGQCRAAVVDLCDGSQTCEDAQLPCCRFLSSCNFRKFIYCLEA